jgi:Uma2 family endonuclease
METNEKEAKKKKELKKYPEEKDEKIMLEEPAAAYGYFDAPRYSYADYLTWVDGKLREIMNGVVKLFSAPRTEHALISCELTREFLNHIKRRKGKCKVFHAPFDVRLPKNGETADDKIYTVVQPDVCVVCDLSKLDERGCLGAPDLVVEIPSPSTARYDMTEKFSAYELAGVREYWIVFSGDCAITVFRLSENGKFDKGTVYEHDAIVTSQVLEGLEISLRELFDDL